MWRAFAPLEITPFNPRLSCRFSARLEPFSSEAVEMTE
jgi:hypothetical protein